GAHPAGEDGRHSSSNAMSSHRVSRSRQTGTWSATPIGRRRDERQPLLPQCHGPVLRHDTPLHPLRGSPSVPRMETSFAHLIGGELVPGSRHFDVINPATGAPFARCPDATQDDVNRAMGVAACAAAGPWSRDEGLRRRTLTAMGEALAARPHHLRPPPSPDPATPPPTPPRP